MWINGIKRLPIRKLEAYYPVSLFITYFPILSICLGLEAALRFLLSQSPKSLLPAKRHASKTTVNSDSEQLFRKQQPRRKLFN